MPVCLTVTYSEPEPSDHLWFFLRGRWLDVKKKVVMEIEVIIVYSAKKAKLNNGLPTTNNST